jgi:hypothetical protein
MELTVTIVNIADAEEKHVLSTPDGAVPAVGDQVDLEISGDATKSFLVQKREFKFGEAEVNVVLLAARVPPEGEVWDEERVAFGPG